MSAHSSPTSTFLQTLTALTVGFTLPMCACLGSFVVIMFTLAALPSSAGTTLATQPTIAVIRVEGPIMSGEGGAFAEVGAYARTLVDYIEQANADDNVKAIVLAVNSPGGGVVASDEIYHALQKVDKPVVVVMGELAASGGYYISMAGDWLIANPNTLTGSIGVISEFPNAEGLLEKVGVDFVVITSGPRKDIGSAYREMTDAERAYWQTIIDETYANFAEIVAAGRDLPLDEVKRVADGSIYTGEQALELHLVDALGYEEDAIAKAADLSGYDVDELAIIEYEGTPSFFDALANATRSPSLTPSLAELLTWVGTPRLSARWVGP